MNYNNNKKILLGKKVERKNFPKNNNHNHNNNHYNNNHNNNNNHYNNNHHNNNHYNHNNFNGNRNSNSNSEVLPIFSKKQEIVDQINKNRVIIVSGNTGCGKSTQVPQYIFEKNKDSKILITQPRRIAAISIAKRLSYEMKSKLGDLIGYQVSMISHFSS